MALFAICVSGYEEYHPIWFSKECSVEDFKKSSKKAIGQVVKELIDEKDESYIFGNDILDKIVPIMGKMRFKVVKPELEIDLQGECHYSDDRPYPRPEIFDDETWKLIIEHNDKIDKM